MRVAKFFLRCYLNERILKKQPVSVDLHLFLNAGYDSVNSSKDSFLYAVVTSVNNAVTTPRSSDFSM